VLGLIILNSYILLSTCCDQNSQHRELHPCLVRNMLAHAVKQIHRERPLVRPAKAAIRVSRPDTNDNSISLFHENDCSVVCVSLVELQEKRVVLKQMNHVQNRTNHQSNSNNLPLICHFGISIQNRTSHS